MLLSNPAQINLDTNFKEQKYDFNIISYNIIMFPINTDLKFYESAIPDTNFNDRVGTITNSNWAPLEDKKYEKSAFGVGLHGLNYQNLVTNFKDFNGTKIYTGYNLLS